MVLITTGELCLSPIGLSKVTQLSTKTNNWFCYGFLVFIFNISSFTWKIYTSGQTTSNDGLLGNLNSRMPGVETDCNAEAMVLMIGLQKLDLSQ